jgi:hypothetical protein
VFISSGGVSYFTYDSGATALYDHAHHLNSVMAGADLLHPENQRVIPAFLGAMYHQFKQDNKYAIQLRNYGDRFRDQLPNQHLDNTTEVGRSVIAEVISTQFRQRMNVVSSPFQVSMCLFLIVLCVN